MKNLPNKFLKFSYLINRSKIPSLLILLTLVLTIPLSVYLVRQQQEVRSRAQGITPGNGEDGEKKEKPEYAKGEVLVKFKGKGLELRRKDISTQAIDLDKGPIKAEEVNEETLPPALRELNQKYQIKEIDKVFKGFSTPQQEINEIKGKMQAKEIQERQINEEELQKIDLSKIYKLTFNEKIPVELLIGELQRNPEVLYAEPNFIYKATQITPKSVDGGASLILSPESQSVKIGATFSAQLLLVNEKANNITGVDVTTKYNKDIIEIINFQPAAIFDNQLINQVDNKAGTLRYSAVNTSQENNTRNINIGTITLKAKKEGTSNVTFENVQITALGQSNSLPTTSNITGSYTVVTTTFTPNDPYYLDHYPDNVGNRDPNWNPSYDYQWNLKKINMEQAWDIATPSAQVLVAVIDTGVDYTHPELGGCTLDQVNHNQCAKVAPGFDFVNADDDPMDDYNHGTHVAGTIASTTNNNRGIAGVGPNAKIIPLKGLDYSGSGFTSNLALAVYEAVIRGARVINASWGGRGNSLIFTNAITYAYLNSVTFVASAGNSNLDTVGFSPANITCATEENPDRDCTITVASTDQNDTRSSFSNWGTMIDLSAPGGDRSGNVLSLKSSQGQPRGDSMIGTEYIRMSGTSMAAPHVAALAAMILGKNSALTTDQVRNILINGTDDLGSPSFDNQYGYGRINAERTLRNMDTTIPAMARISSPLEGFLLGKKFKIFGSAYGNNFLRFSIEHSQSISSSSWSSQGVLLEREGNSSIHNGLLAAVDLSNEPGGTRYLRLTTHTNDGRSAYTIISVRIDNSIRDNFPIPFGSWVVDQKPVIADLNGDGRKEIVFKSFNDAKLYVIEPDGTSLPGWPKDTGEIPGTNFDWYYLTFSPVVVDIDPSYSGLEVIISARKENLERSFGTQLLAFHADGTEVPGWTSSDWERKGYLSYINDTLSSIVVDGQNAVVYVAEVRFDENTPARLHVFGRDGNDLPGWPVDTDDAAIWGTPLVADTDGDGKSEIVVNYLGNKIRVYSSRGVLQREIQLPANDGEYISNLAIADLDNDGFFEIVATAVEHPRAEPGIGSISTRGSGGDPDQRITTIGRVYAWDYQGNLKSSRFPIVLQETQDYYADFNLLTIGDFDNNSYPEILTFLFDKYYLIDKDGNFVRGFPASGLTPYYARPSFASNVTLNNNSHLAVVGDPGYWSGLNLYEYDPGLGVFARANGYPKDFTTSMYLTGTTGNPSLIDIDGNGGLELVVPVEVAPAGLSIMVISYLYVFNSDYSARFLDWPQYLHDERHTGAYVGASPSAVPTRLSLSLKLQGIGSEGRENRNPVRRERIVSLQVLNDARERVSSTSAVLRFDGNNFVGSASLGALNSGQYYFKAKADNSISKLLNTLPVSITPGTPVATQSATLTMGDVNNDNNINISDFTLLRNCFSSNTQSQNWNSCQSSDFNDDGRISGVDYSRLLTNFFRRGE